jgi:thioredoxin reductase
MEFWSRHMPAGMFLRSAWEASHIADPAGVLTLDAFALERGVPIPRPVPMADYLAYGRWFKDNAVPEVDERRVATVSPGRHGFSVRLADGDELNVRRVVHATGLKEFAWRPAPFSGLPGELVSHAADHVDLSPFAGRSVLVVGAGQSALESAALLAESGAEVEILARAPALRWLRGGRLRTRLGPLRPLFYPATDVGPPGLNHLMARPLLLRRLPPRLRESAATRSIRPAGAAWLRGRLGSVPVTLGAEAEEVEAHPGGVRLRLSDGSARTVEHVFLATGYHVDVARCALLSRTLLADLERKGGFPVLSPALESSVPGLHFVGATASGSYGPLMKFVSGTRFASSSVAGSVAGSARRTPLALAARPVPPLATPHHSAPSVKRNAPATTR